MMHFDIYNPWVYQQGKSFTFSHENTSNTFCFTEGGALFSFENTGLSIVFFLEDDVGEGPNGECCRLLSTLTSSLRNEMGGAKRPGPVGPGGHFHGDGVGWIWRCVSVFLMFFCFFEKTQGDIWQQKITSQHNSESMFNKKMEGVELVTGLTRWVFETSDTLLRCWGPVTTSRMPSKQTSISRWLESVKHSY